MASDVSKNEKPMNEYSIDPKLVMDYSKLENQWDEF